MRLLGFNLFMVATTFCFGCTSTRNDSLARGEQITYYDINGDGKVDLEKHHYQGFADADWELRDDDYDGRYETKVLFGFTIITSAVDIPVPANVHIEAK